MAVVVGCLVGGKCRMGEVGFGTGTGTDIDFVGRTGWWWWWRWCHRKGT